MQKLTFLFMMSFAMALGMRSYNVLLRYGIPTREMLLPIVLNLFLMCAIAMLVQFLIAGPVVRRLAARLVEPGRDSRNKIIFYVSSLSTCVMCPLMSAIATLLYRFAEGPFAEVWFKTFAFNLPFSFVWQLLFAGPTVRFLYRRIFAEETRPVFRTLTRLQGFLRG